jgi:hypothetical protein
LASYDSKVYKLLTPEASRGKSYGLLNSGKNVMSQRHLSLKPREQALQAIEESYAEDLYPSDLYNNALSGTLLIK